jgi:hypothetical protein
VLALDVLLRSHFGAIDSKLGTIVSRIEQLEAHMSRSTPVHGIVQASVSGNEIREKSETMKPTIATPPPSSTASDSLDVASMPPRDVSEVTFPIFGSVPRGDSGERFRSSLVELLALSPTVAPVAPLDSSADPPSLLWEVSRSAPALKGTAPLAADALGGGTLPQNAPLSQESTASSSWSGPLSLPFESLQPGPAPRPHIMDSLLADTPVWTHSAPPEIASTNTVLRQEPTRGTVMQHGMAPVDNAPANPRIIPIAGPLVQPQAHASPSATPPVTRNPPSKTGFTWGACNVQFRFGTQPIKNDKVANTNANKIKDYDGFTGEGSNQLADLATLLLKLEEEMERVSWSEEAFSKIMRANITKTARAMIKSCTTWHDILTTLFTAFATEEAMAAVNNDMRTLRMQHGENALTFVTRVTNLFDLFGSNVSDSERARRIVETLEFHSSAYSPKGRALLLQLQVVCGPGHVGSASKVATIKTLLQNAPVAAISMVPRRGHDEQRKGRDKTEKSRKDAVCFDCGVKGEIVGHHGCKAPGARKFGTLKDDKSKGKKKDEKRTDEKPKTNKQTGAKQSFGGKRANAATDHSSAATPNVRISLTLENGAVLEGVVDSGATSHFISRGVAQEMGLPTTPCAPIKVGSAETGGGFVVTATADVRVFIGTKLVLLTLNVADGVAETLLSYRLLMKACPGTSWSTGADGNEELFINGVRFMPDPDGGTWKASTLTTEEFAVRATRLSGTEATMDPASAKSRFRPSSWLAFMDGAPRPFTLREEASASTYERHGWTVERAVTRRLAGDWRAHFTSFLIPGSEEQIEELAWACAAAPSAEAVRKTMCAYDLALQKEKLLMHAYASVMMRTLQADTAALERISSEMRAAGAPEDAVAFFANEIFWPSERKRLEALERPVASRGGNLDFEIELEPGARFFHQRRRNFKPEEAQLILDYVTQQVSIGRGRFGLPSEADIISNFTLALRADNTLRPCGAYVRLNGITVFDRSFVPSVTDALDGINTSHTHFFTADVEAAFNSIYVSEATQRKLALWMPDGRVFFPLVMPFGAKNAPPTFSRNISLALRSVQEVISYFDDTHGGGIDWMSMLHKLKETSEALQAHGFSLSFRKTFVGPDVPLLGLRRTAEGLFTDPKRLEEIRNLPSPETKTELRSQIGMLRWVTPFIPGDDDVHGLAEAIGPFDKLTSKTAVWAWTADTETRWRKILGMLAHAVALNRPDFTRDFILDTDASKTGWGYILYQLDDKGQRKILRIGSRAFKGAMADAAPVHQEAHAVVNAMVDCEDWLAFGHTIIHTDHRPLLWLLHNVQLSPRLWGGKALRWTLLLQNFSWRIEHVAGTNNIVPDVLSRMPWPDSLQVRRQKDPDARAMAARKMPVIQRRLDKNDNGDDLLMDDSDDDVTSESQSVPSVPQPPAGFDDDVFERIAVAILNGGDIPPQFENPIFSDTIALVRKHVDNLEMRGDRLWHKTDGAYVRAEERNAILYEVHNAPTGGHFGFDKTYGRLHGRAWWPSCRKDVAAYLHLCGICQRCKAQPQIPSDVAPLPVAAIFERLHLDLMGPFPESGAGFRYIFTAKDSATKYAVIRPLRSKEAVEVTGELVRSIFTVFGFPSSIVTDQGTEFVNKLNAGIFERLAIEHRPTAPYHPASNGQVERSHREINAMLRVLCSPDQHDWAEMLPYVEFAINTAKTSTTLLSPFFLMFGRHPYTTLDVRLDLPFPKGEPLGSFMGRLMRMRELAAIRDGRARRVDQTDRKRLPALRVGDFVLVRFTGTGEGRSSKLSPLYQGPFKVISVRNGNTAVLENVRNPKDRIERHFERLVRFRGSLGEVEGEDEWEISAIVDEAVDSGETFFLVRWRGLPPGSDSWVREADLFADDLLREWRVHHPVSKPTTTHKAVRPKRRKPKANESVVVERIVGHRGTERNRMFQVAVGEDCGPSDYIWVREEQVANPEKLVAYLESMDRPA